MWLLLFVIDFGGGIINPLVVSFFHRHTPERLLGGGCAPAIGAAIAIAATLAGDLLGVKLDGRAGPAALLALAGGGGWLLALRARGRAAT